MFQNLRSRTSVYDSTYLKHSRKPKLMVLVKLLLIGITILHIKVFNSISFPIINNISKVKAAILVENDQIKIKIGKDEVLEVDDYIKRLKGTQNQDDSLLKPIINTWSNIASDIKNYEGSCSTQIKNLTTTINNSKNLFNLKSLLDMLGSNNKLFERVKVIITALFILINNKGQPEHLEYPLDLELIDIISKNIEKFVQKFELSLDYARTPSIKYKILIYNFVTNLNQIVDEIRKRKTNILTTLRNNPNIEPLIYIFYKYIEDIEKIEEEMYRKYNKQLKHFYKKVIDDKKGASAGPHMNSKKIKAYPVTKLQKIEKLSDSDRLDVYSTKKDPEQTQNDSIIEDKNGLNIDVTGEKEEYTKKKLPYRIKNKNVDLENNRLYSDSGSEESSDNLLGLSRLYNDHESFFNDEEENLNSKKSDYTIFETNGHINPFLESTADEKGIIYKRNRIPKPPRKISKNESIQTNTVDLDNSIITSNSSNLNGENDIKNSKKGIQETDKSKKQSLDGEVEKGQINNSDKVNKELLNKKSKKEGTEDTKQKDKKDDKKSSFPFKTAFIITVTTTIVIIGISRFIYSKKNEPE